MLRKAYEICDNDTRGAERTHKQQKLFFSVYKASQSTWAQMVQIHLPLPRCLSCEQSRSVHTD